MPLWIPLQTIVHGGGGYGCGEGAALPPDPVCGEIGYRFLAFSAPKGIEVEGIRLGLLLPSDYHSQPKSLIQLMWFDVI